MAAAEKQEDPLILNNYYIDEQKQQQKRGHDLSIIKCPRCNSSNTKFCYYNNYSLSQPRHLCKACKRYWTRGGTLRNVPASSNSRRRRPRNNKTTTTLLNITKPNNIGLINQQPDLHVNNPLFFNSLQPTNPDLQLNSPFSSTARVSGSDDDQRPEINGFGIGFSSSGFNMASHQFQIINTTHHHHNHNWSSSSKQIRDAVTNCSFPSRFGCKDYDDTQNDYFPGLMPNYQDIHILPTGGLIDGGIFNNLERENMTNIHQIPQHLNSSLLSNTSNSSSCFQLDP